MSFASINPATAGVRQWLSAKIMEKLLFFPWPGNVRQLANVVWP
jgi:transcriptional regulator of acetoin/glycerol metabolism